MAADGKRMRCCLAGFCSIANANKSAIDFGVMCGNPRKYVMAAVKLKEAGISASGRFRSSFQNGSATLSGGDAADMVKPGCEGSVMRARGIFAASALALAVILGLGGCSGMSTRDRNTIIGAGVGAVGGAVLTGGSATGTVGGAAVGGIIGHEVGK